MAALCMAEVAVAQTRISSPPAKSSNDSEAPSLGVVEWLQRMHAASRQRSYAGTFVVSAEAGNLSSARIWHVCEGDLQMERIEALSGPPRSTFRRNDHVVTFLPESKIVKSEKRENLELFPNLLGSPDSSIADFYDARVIGKDRVAGFDTDVVQLEPRDNLRFGYRVWSERRSGLVVKLQTIDGEKKVIEQSAFSELQLDAPVKIHALAQMMGSTAGYRVEKSELERTTALSEGWALKKAVAGFKPINCYRRPMAGRGPGAYDAVDFLGWPCFGIAVPGTLRCTAQASGGATRSGGNLYAHAPIGRQGRRLVADCGGGSAAADDRRLRPESCSGALSRRAESVG